MKLIDLSFSCSLFGRIFIYLFIDLIDLPLSLRFFLTSFGKITSIAFLDFKTLPKLTLKVVIESLFHENVLLNLDFLWACNNFMLIKCHCRFCVGHDHLMWLQELPSFLIDLLWCFGFLSIDLTLSTWNLCRKVNLLISSYFDLHHLCTVDIIKFDCSFSFIFPHFLHFLIKAHSHGIM